MHHGISFSSGPLSLTAFSDANWARDPIDRRSTIGLLDFLGPNHISWSAKKQPTVSHSSTEAKCRALATFAAELSWLRILVKELKIFLPYVPVIWCDNVSTITLSANPVFHSKTKHLELDYHYVREKVLCRNLKIGFVSSKDNMANIFTKPLFAPPFLFFHFKLLVDSSLYRLRGDVEDEAQATQGKGSGSTANTTFEVITVKVITVVVISNVHRFIKVTDDVHCFLKGTSDAHRFGYMIGVSSSCIKQCRLGLFKRFVIVVRRAIMAELGFP